MASNNIVKLASLNAINFYEKIKIMQAMDDGDMDDFFYETEMNFSQELVDLVRQYNDFSVKRKKRKVIRISGYIERVIRGYSELEFRQNFRLQRNSFEVVLQCLRSIVVIPETGRHFIDLEKQFMAVLCILATPDSYRSVGEKFDLAKSSLSRAFVRIINGINHLSKDYIKWPSGENLSSAKASFSSIYFPSVIGAIDGTYVSCTVPNAQRNSYTNRKCFTSITLQAIYDGDMKYLDCYVGWPSSVPDIRVFKNSPIYLKSQVNRRTFFPNDEFILGDKAYPALVWCIPPYMDRGRLTRKQKLFNKRHASMRQVVERSFALIFGRFRRLKHLDMKRIDWIPATIMACCVLHNVCLNSPDENIEDFIIAGISTQINNTTINEGDVNISNADGLARRTEICNNMP